MKWYEDEVKPEVIANDIFNNSTIISGQPIEAGGLISKHSISCNAALDKVVKELAVYNIEAVQMSSSNNVREALKQLQVII